VKTVYYTCATCAALVAYSERLAELAENKTLTDAIRITQSDLVGFFPEVPYYKNDRAALAVQALQYAICAVVNQSDFQLTPISVQLRA
jgi:hypothetical protein